MLARKIRKIWACTLPHLVYLFKPIVKHGLFHMTPHREWFGSYEGLDGWRILLGDDRAYNVIGRGSIQRKYLDRRIRYFPNVRHVHGMRRNLLSMS
jgi:hypothetical protein